MNRTALVTRPAVTALLTTAVATALAAAATTLPSTAPAADVESARQIFHDYAAAMALGDAAATRSFVLADARRMPLVDGRPAAADAERQFRAAVEKAFPGATSFAPATEPATRAAPDVDPPTVRIDGDTATLVARNVIDPVKLRRVDGRWKIDLDAMYPAAIVDDLVLFRRALQDVMTALTTDVAAGRFKSYDAVQAELETRVKMKLATPDESAATRPAF